MISSGTRRILDMARRAEPDAGKWYHKARVGCAKMAQRHGVSLSSVVGIIAALSPGCSWERNIADTQNLLTHGNTASGFGTYGPNVKKARRILAGEKSLKVLGGQKVTNFYMCIMRPWSRIPVCIDRHAMTTVVGHKLTSKERSAMAKTAQYRKLETMYREAAAIAGMRPSEIQAAAWVAQRGAK